MSLIIVNFRVRKINVSLIIWMKTEFLAYYECSISQVEVNSIHKNDRRQNYLPRVHNELAVTNVI